MNNQEAVTVIKDIATLIQCDFPSRVKAVAAVQHIENELASVSLLRAELDALRSKDAPRVTD